MPTVLCFVALLHTQDPGLGYIVEGPETCDKAIHFVIEANKHPTFGTHFTWLSAEPQPLFNAFDTILPGEKI